MHPKNLTKYFEKTKMAAKSKMASKTNVFVFLLQNLQFSTDFNKLFCIRSVFLLSNFNGRKKRKKIQNGDLVQDGVIFLS
jgi:hypothetical protein